MSESEIEEFEERAAILEYEAGFIRQEADRLAGTLIKEWKVEI